MNQENQRPAYAGNMMVAASTRNSYSDRLNEITIQRLKTEAEYKKKSDRLPKLSDDRVPTRVYTPQDFNRVPEPQYAGGLEKLTTVSAGVEE